MRALAFEEDVDAVACGVLLAAAVGLAVCAANRIENETGDVTGLCTLAVATNGSLRTIGVAFALLTAGAFVFDLDPGAASFAGIAVGLAVCAADRREDVGANATVAEAGAATGARAIGHRIAGAAVATRLVRRAGRAALASVQNLYAVARGIDGAAAVGVTVGSADWIRYEAGDLASRAALAVATHRLASAVVVARALTTLTFVSDLDAGTARFAGVVVGLAVDAADRIEDVGANARFAEAGATARVRALFDRFASAVCGAGFVGGANSFTLAFVDHHCTVALGVDLAAEVCVAVAAAHWIGNETLYRAGGPALVVAADGVAGAVVVAATFPAALAFVGNFDSGASRFAGVAIRLAVKTADWGEDIGADARIAAALAVVNDANAGAARFALVGVGLTITAADRIENCRAVAAGGPAGVFALFEREEVVVVALASAVEETFALVGFLIEEPARDRCLARADDLGLFADRSVVASFFAGFGRLEVVAVAAAASVDESLAPTALRIEEPARDCRVARPDFSRQATDVGLVRTSGDWWTRFEPTWDVEKLTALSVRAGEPAARVGAIRDDLAVWRLEDAALLVRATEHGVARIWFAACFATLTLSLEVVLIAAAAAVDEVVAAVGFAVEEPTRDGSPARARLDW